ncbi:MAG TPA: hypothetical protein VFA48_09145 [Gammaproteobacteria bacterium]|nr:hypothetical protein [Gammaproteobacteria bacterium]
MNSRDFWQSLKEDWQSVSPKVDLVALRRQLERKRRRMLVFMTFDVVTALIATGLLLGIGIPPALSFGPAMPWLMVTIMWAAVVIGGWLRLSTWKTDDMDAAGLLRLGLRRARAGMAFVWLNIFGMPIIYAIFAPGFWHLWHTGDKMQRDHVLVSISVNAAFYLVVIAWGVWYGRRQRRKMRRAHDLLQQLEQNEGGNRWNL